MKCKKKIKGRKWKEIQKSRDLVDCLPGKNKIKTCFKEKDDIK